MEQWNLHLELWNLLEGSLGTLEPSGTFTCPYLPRNLGTLRDCPAPGPEIPKLAGPTEPTEPGELQLSTLLGCRVCGNRCCLCFVMLSGAWADGEWHLRIASTLLFSKPAALCANPHQVQGFYVFGQPFRFATCQDFSGARCEFGNTSKTLLPAKRTQKKRRNLLKVCNSPMSFQIENWKEKMKLVLS